MKSLFTLFLLLLPIFGFSQSSNISTHTPDERLFEVFDTDYIERLQKANAFLIEYYNIFLDHAWEIQPFPEGKLGSIQSVDFEPAEIEQVNILHLIKKYQLERSQKAFNYYRIGNSDQVLVLFSGDHFGKKLNELTGRTYQK